MLSIPLPLPEVPWKFSGNFQANRIFPCTPFLEPSRPTGSCLDVSWKFPGGSGGSGSRRIRIHLESSRMAGVFPETSRQTGCFQACQTGFFQGTSWLTLRTPGNFQEGCWKTGGMDIRISFLEVSWWDARRESALFRDFTVFSWILPGRFLGTSWILPGSFQGGGGHFCKTR